MGIKQEKGETSHRQRPAVSLGADGAGDGLAGLQASEQQREEGDNKSHERYRILHPSSCGGLAVRETKWDCSSASLIFNNSR